jgi:HTH-type transcriptional regulator/antitoxin HigA
VEDAITIPQFVPRFTVPEAIKFRMEQQGLTRRDLDEIIGTRTRIAEVLNTKRGLSIGMIRHLHKHLGISAEVLIRSSRKNAA